VREFFFERNKSEKRRLRMRIRTRQQRNEKGVAELVSMLVAAGILLVLASVMIPSIVEAKRVSTEVAAAEALNQIGAISTTYSHEYGAYVAPQYLTGTLPTTAVPASCSNAFLLNAAQVQAPEGYTMAFTGTPQTGWSCAGVPAGYSSYSILLQPTNSLFAQRSFEMAQDGILHFSDEGPATPSSPVYSITAANGVVTLGGTGAGTSNSSGNGTGIVQTWNPTSSVQVGQEFLESATDPLGGHCAPASNGLVGPFIALSSTSSDPCQNPSNWFYAGPGSLTYSLPCGGVQTGTISSLQINPTQAYVPAIGLSAQQITSSSSICGTFTHLILTEIAGVPLGPNGIQIASSGEVTMGIYDTTTGSGVWGCQEGNGAPITYGQSSFTACETTGSPWGGSMTVNFGDTLMLVVSTGAYNASNPYQMQNVTFILQ
jgi:hypothetical protein